ncbi:MAG: Spy/CpxP family protein refolding chaperone [Gemmatimonadaceae bacterium]
MQRINAVALGAALLIGIAGVAGAQAQSTQPPATGKVQAQRGPRAEGRRGFRRDREFGGRLAKDLNLTDAQKAQFKTIHQKYRPQLEAIRNQYKSQFENIRSLRQKGDTAGARAAFARIRGEIQSKSLAIRNQENADIRNVLTADQRTKFDAAQAQRKKWMDEHKDGFGRGYNRSRGTAPQKG